MHAYEKGRHVLFLLEPSPAGSFSHIKKRQENDGYRLYRLRSRRTGTQALVKRLSEKGHDVHDLGPATTESCDYPVYAKGVCGKVLADAGNATPGDEPASFGILVCGTGIGMSMTANHIPGIRAALCGCEFQARATRQHNNANVLCLGERVTGQGVALDIAELFLNTAFEGGRHLRRINQIEG